LIKRQVEREEGGREKNQAQISAQTITIIDRMRIPEGIERGREDRRGVVGRERG
jgi:hypothetical protein